MANLIALICNWWSFYGRHFDEDHHREAITTRPALLSGVARQISHAGQRRIRVSILHEKGDIIAKAITHISSVLQDISAITARWSPERSWALILTRLFRGKLGGKWLAEFPAEVLPLLSG